VEIPLRSSAPSAPLILVVEDDVDIRAMLVDLLRVHGFQAHEAANGSLALAWLRETTRRPDLILLDLRMPVMDGGQFRLEQSKDPALASIPVLLISAELHAAREADALGVTAFLAKPFDVDELFGTIGWILLTPGADPNGALKPGGVRPRTAASREPLSTRRGPALKNLGEPSSAGYAP